MLSEEQIRKARNRWDHDYSVEQRVVLERHARRVMESHAQLLVKLIEALGKLEFLKAVDVIRELDKEVAQRTVDRDIYNKVVEHTKKALSHFGQK